MILFLTYILSVSHSSRSTRAEYLPGDLDRTSCLISRHNVCSLGCRSVCDSTSNEYNFHRNEPVLCERLARKGLLSTYPAAAANTTIVFANIQYDRTNAKNVVKQSMGPIHFNVVLIR